MGVVSSIYALGEVVDRGDVDHGFGGGGQGLGVAGEAPLEHPRLRSTAQRLLTTWKPRTAGFLLTTSTSIPRLAPCSMTAFLKPVTPSALGDGRVGLLGLVEELDADGVLGQARGGDRHGEDEFVSVRMPRFLPTIFFFGVGSLAG